MEQIQPMWKPLMFNYRLKKKTSVVSSGAYLEKELRSGQRKGHTGLEGKCQGHQEACLESLVVIYWKENEIQAHHLSCWNVKLSVAPASRGLWWTCLQITCQPFGISNGRPCGCYGEVQLVAPGPTGILLGPRNAPLQGTDPESQHRKLFLCHDAMSGV